MTSPLPLVVLALDIAKNRTGWAVGSPAWERPYWGVHEMAGDWQRHEGRRLLEWRAFLSNTMNKYQVSYMAMERLFVDVKNFDFNGTQPMLMFHAIALELAEERGIPTGDVSIKTWRSHFLGSSVAPKHVEKATPFWKELAVKAAAARNWYVTFHDEAEALGILDTVLAFKDPDYLHKTGAHVRRQEQRRDLAAFRGEG